MASLRSSIFLMIVLAVAAASSGKIQKDYNGEPCYSVGLSCSTRNTVALCVQTSSGFEQIDVETCNPGFRCSYTNKRCVPEVNKCRQPGVFPHPYDCHAYYRCGENLENLPEYDGEIDYCIRYYHFDVATGQCEIHTAPGECEDGPQAVPDCKEFLQTGALEANNNYYYVCARAATGELYPKVYKCEDTYYFDVEAKKCTFGDS